MKLELDRDDLVSLVKGSTPNYSVMENDIVKRHGSYSGSYGIWEWNAYGLEKCKEEELLEIYKTCKDSWK